MELDGSDNLVRKYTWALDLAGQHGSVNSLEAAGGIGGLLAVAQAQVGGDVLYESGLRTDLHDHQFGLAANKELA
jgi:hypothetical protein